LERAHIGLKSSDSQSCGSKLGSVLGLDRELLKLVLPVGRRLAVLQSCLGPCKLFRLELCTFLVVTRRRSCVSQCSLCLAPTSIGSLHLGRASVTQPFQAGLCRFQVIQGPLKSTVAAASARWASPKAPSVSRRISLFERRVVDLATTAVVGGRHIVAIVLAPSSSSMALYSPYVRFLKQRSEITDGGRPG
jgi:hypothetical protein